MHPRQRNVGNGHRSESSDSIGMGMSRSRSSDERPMRGHGFYGSHHQRLEFNCEYRQGSGRSKSYQDQLLPQPVQYSSDHQRRGFNLRYERGRGRSKSYQNQLPPQLEQHSSGGDNLFMEAGRLAAEYLVSQGDLPHTVVSSKWQDDNFRKHAGEFQSSRPQEAARVDISAPLTGKRSYLDGYNSAGSRYNLKGRRSHRYDSDFGRSSSWSERSKAFQVETGDDDDVSRHREEQLLAEDIASSVQRSASGKFLKKLERAGESEYGMDNYSLQDEAQSKTGSSSAEKEIVHDCEISKVSEGSSCLSVGSEDIKGLTDGNDGENENQTAIEDASIHQHYAADESFTQE